jgi:CheY-like chemotaxis protein
MDAVLVVDDDRAFVERVVAFLHELVPEREIVAVGDGNAALTRALDLRPAHVLLDVSMPGPDGLRVSHALAQALPATRIAILSGEAPDESAVPDGAVFIRKDERLEDALRALLVEA